MWLALRIWVLTLFFVSDPEDKQDETKTIASQLIQALGIIQGVVLNHKPTKAFLGRKYSLEVRVPDLLLFQELTSLCSDPC